MSETNTNMMSNFETFPNGQEQDLMPIVITVIHHCSRNASKCVNNKKQNILWYLPECRRQNCYGSQMI